MASQRKAQGPDLGIETRPWRWLIDLKSVILCIEWDGEREGALTRSQRCLPHLKMKAAFSCPDSLEAPPHRGTLVCLRRLDPALRISLPLQPPFKYIEPTVCLGLLPASPSSLSLPLQFRFSPVRRVSHRR